MKNPTRGYEMFMFSFLKEMFLLGKSRVIAVKTERIFDSLQINITK